MRNLLRPRLRRVIVLTVLASVVLLVVLSVQANAAADTAAERYLAAKAAFEGALQQARAQGYTEQDLQPIPARGAQVEAQSPPLLPSLKADFYTSSAAQLDSLRALLQSQEETAVDDARAAAAASLQMARDQLSQDDRLGVDPQQLQPLETQLSKVDADYAAGTLPRDFLAVRAQADADAAAAARLGREQSAENQALAAAARALELRTGMNLAAIRQAGAGPLAGGRNDASVASFMGLSLLDGADRQLEHYASLLRSPNPDQAALGAIGVQHYADLIHRGLLAHLPHQAVIVSLQAQELWAYQDGRLILDSLVTTGRPQLPTDVGAMHVLFKSSPWTMKSPWPKSSPWWYPDTVVQMAIFFTDTGESLHDAAWEPDGYYGPGSQYTGVASHGCIHVPYANEVTLYRWIQIGTPVVVYPGDGSPVASQMAQISVDSSGEPVTGPRGV